MPDLLAAFPAMIRAELKRRDMSQRDLAADIGTNSSTITRILRGQGMCDVATFVRLCTWLRVEPADVSDEQLTAAYRHGWNDCAAALRAAMEEIDNA